jgi:hypothetical protein
MKEKGSVTKVEQEVINLKENKNLGAKTSQVGLQETKCHSNDRGKTQKTTSRKGKNLRFGRRKGER